MENPDSQPVTPPTTSSLNSVKILCHKDIPGLFAVLVWWHGYY